MHSDITNPDLIGSTELTILYSNLNWTEQFNLNIEPKSKLHKKFKEFQLI